MIFCPKERIVSALVTVYGAAEADMVLRAYALDLDNAGYAEASGVIDALADLAARRVQ